MATLYMQSEQNSINGKDIDTIIGHYGVGTFISVFSSLLFLPENGNA
jgi:hypothetical protein